MINLLEAIHIYGISRASLLEALELSNVFLLLLEKLWKLFRHDLQNAESSCFFFQLNNVSKFTAILGSSSGNDFSGSHF